MKVYDMLVLGGGPGGYTAALYAARAGLEVLVLEQLSAGGQMAQSHRIDNYPGFEEGIDGFDLGTKMQAQAHRFGAQTEYTRVLRVDLRAHPKRVETGQGVFLGKTLVLATGAGPKPLGLEGESALTGRGVAYCAACDGMFYRDKTVVVGGGDSAAGEALVLSRIAKKVILAVRRDTLRATKVYHKPLLEAENVQILYNTQVTRLHGDQRLTAVTLVDTQTGGQTLAECQGLFVSIGRKPATEPFRDQLPLDPEGYVIAGETTETDAPGVYAVGDLRTKQLRQVVTAVADGAMAAHMAQEYLAQGH